MSQNWRPRKVYPAQYVQPEEKGEKHRTKSDGEDHEINLVVDELIGPTWEKAMTGPYAQEWEEAMIAEFESIQGSGAWVLVKRPKNQHVIGCRWVLRT